MAACSPKEAIAALEVMEWLEQPVPPGDLFDEGFEWIRHMLLEAWVESRAADVWRRFSIFLLPLSIDPRNPYGLRRRLVAPTLFVFASNANLSMSGSFRIRPFGCGLWSPSGELHNSVCVFSCPSSTTPCRTLCHVFT